MGRIMNAFIQVRLEGAWTFYPSFETWFTTNRAKPEFADRTSATNPWKAYLCVFLPGTNHCKEPDGRFDSPEISRATFFNVGYGVPEGPSDKLCLQRTSYRSLHTPLKNWNSADFLYQSIECCTFSLMIKNFFGDSLSRNPDTPNTEKKRSVHKIHSHFLMCFNAVAASRTSHKAASNTRLEIMVPSYITPAGSRSWPQ